MKTYVYIILAVFFAVFLKNWEPGLGNSSAGYGGIARNLAQDWQWFHLKLSKEIFNPYVDHPPLAIWLMGLVIKVFGSSAHTVRLLSEISAILVFTCLFLIVRRQFSERAAVFSVLSLLLVNVFMNYTASGWIDMPMIAFVWGGAYFLFRSLDGYWRLPSIFLGAFLLGCAVLAKGICALAVFPVFGLFAYKQHQLKRWYFWPVVGLVVVLPVALFTWAHYSSQGFLFWQQYLHREINVQTLYNEQKLRWLDYLWHFKDSFRFGHVITLLGLCGVVRLWRQGAKDWASFILAGVLIHNIGYSWSTRHYSQYVIPVFPFLAIGAGYFLDQKFKRFDSEQIARVVMILMIAVFVAVDLFPIRVKSGNENPFRSFQSTLRVMNDNKNVYFIGTMENQESWEDPASYIVWYWGREPRMTSLEGLFEKINEADPRALGIIDTTIFEQRDDLRALYPNVQRCMYNDKLTVVAQPLICDDHIRTLRLRERPQAQWERAP